MFEKKNLFLIIFGIVFLMLSFGEIKQNAPTTKAAGCQASCNNGNGITCASRCFYTDPHAVPGSNGGSCSVGTNLGLCNPLLFFDASCSSAEMSCNENNCSGLSANNGDPCVVVMGGWTGFACTTDVKNGIWDASQGKCIECGGLKESSVCADGSSIKLVGGVCNVSDNSFEIACDAGVAAACDDITEGGACAGGVCDASGQCIISNVLSLTASANPSTMQVNGVSTVTFLVTKGGAPVNAATVENITITGGFISAASCTTGASGECTVIYTAPAVTGAYGINATKATKTGETDSGPASVVITVSSLPIASCGPEIGVLCNPVNNASNFYDVIVIAIRYLLFIIALITLLFIIISGIKYLASFGNEEKMKSAKDGLTFAVFGLILALMAYVILETIIKILSS